MIDLTPLLGTFEWTEKILSNGNVLLVPDIEYICKFIILGIMVLFFLKGIFGIVRAFI